MPSGLFSPGNKMFSNYTEVNLHLSKAALRTVAWREQWKPKDEHYKTSLLMANSMKTSNKKITIKIIYSYTNCSTPLYKLSLCKVEKNGKPTWKYIRALLNSQMIIRMDPNTYGKNSKNQWQNILYMNVGTILGLHLLLLIRSCHSELLFGS